MQPQPGWLTKEKPMQNATAATRKPLWPNGVAIEVLGVTGEYKSGKTLFVLTIDPKQTLYYDLEKSGATYQGLGVTRKDFGRHMQSMFPRGYQAIDLYQAWLNDVRNVKPGQYRVIAVDPITDIEAGLVQWVRANPGHFGYSPGQFAKMEGLMWGAVQQHWKMVLNDLASRCECFAFTAHMGNVWEGGNPVKGKRKPKGKSVLQELASLYILLKRDPDEKGRVPEKPIGYLAESFTKDRLCHFVLNEETGDLEPHPILPPRIVDCTPAKIRWYIQNPANYGKLRKEELAELHTLSEDDRAQIRLAIAEAEAEAARLRLETVERERLAQEVTTRATVTAAPVAPPAPQAPPPAPPAAEVPPPGDTAGCPNGTHTHQEPSPGPAPEPVQLPPSRPKARDEKLQELARLREEMFSRMEIGGQQDRRKEVWQGILAKRGVDSALKLTDEQLDELISRIAHQLNCQDLHDGIHGNGGGEGAVAAPEKSPA
jgi:hypothetical protein